MRPSDQVNVHEVDDQHGPGMGGIPSTCIVRRRNAVRYGSSDLALEKCVKAVDRGIGAVLEQSAVPRQRERDAVVPSPLGYLAYVTACGHHDRYKAVPKAMEGDVVQPSAPHGRPQDVAPPRAEERATCRSGEHKGIWTRVNKLPRGAARVAGLPSARRGRNASSAWSWARCSRSPVPATRQPWTSRGCGSVTGRCRVGATLQLLPSEVRRTRRPAPGRGIDRGISSTRRSTSLCDR